jgi:acetyl esterase/lipase
MAEQTEAIGVSRRSALAGFAVTGLAGCSAVGAFNAVSGRDGGVLLAGSGIPFGSHPRQRLDVYRPSDDGAPGHVVLFIYGGSWSSGRRQDYAFAGSALASLGYVTVVADYRLTPEFVYPAFLDDGALALRWIRTEAQRFGGDPRRVAIVGHSAGAYNAAMLALDRRRLRQNGVDPAIVKAFAGLSGPYDFYPWDSPVSRATFGDWPDPAATQPVNLVRRGAPPAFLATGDADTTVRPRNTESLAARLTAAGAVVDKRIYAGLGHADMVTALSVLDRGKAPLRAELAPFLHRHLGRVR